MIERAQPGPMATILLVDDDPLQASLMTSLLRGRFDEVKRTVDAAEAFCLIEQPEFAGKLGLVISAHHTPGIGGPAFVAELHERMPALPILVVGAPAEAFDYCTDSNVAFLPRPLVAKEMLVMTRRMMSQHKAA